MLLHASQSASVSWLGHTQRRVAVPSTHPCLSSRRAHVISRAGADESSEETAAPSPLEQASEAVQAVLHILTVTRDLDSLLEYLPDEVIDLALAVKGIDGRGARPLSFREVVDLDAASKDWTLDSFASRHLIMATPSTVMPLSNLLVAPDRSVHRYEVRSAAGEVCTLTFSLALQESLQAQYRQAPRITQCWRLRSIVGEAILDELPTGPDVSFGPETVVGAQLDALQRGDAGRVFSFASPVNRAATGPLANFSELLQSPAYAPLLGHMRCERLKRLQLTADTYLEIVAVVAKGLAGPQNHVYLFEVGQQAPDSPEDAFCWGTNAVRPLTNSGPLLGL